MENNLKASFTSNSPDDVITLDNSYNKSKFLRPKYFSLIYCTIILLIFISLSIWIINLSFQNASLNNKILILEGELNDLHIEIYDVSTSYSSVNIAKKEVDIENQKLKDEIKKLTSQIENLYNQIKENQNLPKSEDKKEENPFDNEKAYFTKYLGTTIISTSFEYSFLNSLFPNYSINMQLLYKASQDGDNKEAFHKKCDFHLPTLVLIEDENGNKFGGYTEALWNTEKVDGEFYKSDVTAFLFSLTNKMKFRVSNTEKAIHSGSDFILGFNKDLVVKNHCLHQEGVFSAFPDAYSNGSFTTSLKDLIGNEKNEIKIKELEVFEISFVKNN